MSGHPVRLAVPTAGELHVWAWRRAQLRALDLARPDWLSSEELCDLQRRTPAAREDAMRQRCAVRAVLAAYLDCPVASIELVRGRHGKPALAGRHRLQFSLSHSGDRVLLALGGDGPVGVDLQCIPATPRDDLAARLLGPMAARQYLQGDRAARCRAFALAWAERESLVKAWGLRLGQGWESCQRLFRALPLWAGEVGARWVGGWVLSRVPAGAGHAAVACTRQEIGRLCCGSVASALAMGSSASHGA